MQMKTLKITISYKKKWYSDNKPDNNISDKYCLQGSN